MVVVVGCGGNGTTSTIDAAKPVADLDTRARVCAIIGACIGYSASQCITLLDANATADQLACALAATAADCTAVRACFGQRISTDPSCASGCLDADTVVRCSGGQRVELDCPSSLESVGPVCVMNGRTDCGGAACAVDGEYACTGSTSTFCDSGITEVTECGKLGLECVARAPRCVGIAAGTCTAGTAPACDGDTVVTCDDGTLRRRDCSLFGGRTCVAGACALGAECDPSTPDACTGTTLEVCLAGVRRSIDCTTIGATSCVMNRCR